MVAPYVLLFVSLSTGIALLQLPVLPAPGFVQLFVLLSTPVCLLLWRSRRRRLAQLSIVALIVALSALAVLVPATRWQEQQLPVHCERQALRVEGVVRGLIHHSGSDENLRYRFDVQVSKLSPASCVGPSRIRVYLTPDSRRDSPNGIPDTTALLNPLSEAQPNTVGLLPGARVVVEARLRRPWGRVNPGSRDGEKSFLVAAVHGVGSVTKLHVLAESPGSGLSFSAKRDRMRDAISQDIQHRVPTEVGALLAALAVGDRRGMTPAIWERLRVYGVSHLLVISGMHISLLAAPGWYLGLGLGRFVHVFFPLRVVPRLMPPIFAILTAGSYGLLSGFALPAQRAVLMLLLLMLPRICGRAVTAGRALPVAGFLLFLLNPLGIITASFWLTLGAVALLLWYAAWRGSGRWLQDAGSAQGFMLLAMLPLSLFWFGTASSLGGLINLVAIPLITLAVLPLVFGSILCAQILESFASLQLHLAAKLLAGLWSGMGHWEPLLGPWSVLQSAPGGFTIVLAVVGVLLLPLPPSLARTFMIALLVSPVTIPALRSTSDSVELVFFDVGQGTAVLARHGEYALLYDTGGGPPGGPAIATRSVLPGIFSLGIDALELLVISHPDRDHNAGETLIKQTFRPRRIRQGVGARPSQECRTGESQRMGNDILVHYLSQRLAGDSDNNASCTLVLSVFGRKILLAGDIDSRRERALLAYWGRELQVDVLLAGHHGSASSNSRLWLRSLDPHIMVVTAGRSNRFGHPAARVMETAKEQGINTANTATHGAMIVRIWPDGTMTCEAMRNRWQAFWRRGEFPRDCMAPRSLIRGYNQPHR